jgi:hypothetical protein
MASAGHVAVVGHDHRQLIIRECDLRNQWRNPIRAVEDIELDAEAHKRRFKQVVGSIIQYARSSEGNSPACIHPAGLGASFGSTLIGKAGQTI